jgi:uncharacterized protein (TIGR03435 family)
MVVSERITPGSAGHTVVARYIGCRYNILFYDAPVIRSDCVVRTNCRSAGFRGRIDQGGTAALIGRNHPGRAVKIKEATPDEEPATGGSLEGRINNGVNNGVAISSAGTGTLRMTPSPNGGMQLQMAKITMAALADRLTQFMDRPVVDATGLKGNYQVTLDLPIEAMSGMPFAEKLAALAGSGWFGVPQADTSSAPIIKSVKDLGLELESRKAPIETIIVDRVEKTPTAN